MLNDPLMLQGPLSYGFPLQNGNLKQQIMILMIILDESSKVNLLSHLPIPKFEIQGMGPPYHLGLTVEVNSHKKMEL